MKLLCHKNGKRFLFLVVENLDYKECEYKQYSIVDVERCVSIISCSFCYLQVILEEKKILDYRILEVINDKTI